MKLKTKETLSVTLKVKVGCIREVFKIKKCKSILLLQVTEKNVFMLLSKMIRKSLNSRKRIEKEITLLNFRDIEPKPIGAMVTRNPNLLLESKKNVQIFMLAMISRSNAKNAAKRRGITYT